MSQPDAILYEPGRLQLLEQRALPLETKYVEIGDMQACWDAIKDMTVRGAPAIANAAVLALAADLVKNGSGKQYADVQAAAKDIAEKLDFVNTSRPTAVNMSIACEDLKKHVKKLLEAAGTTPESLVASAVAWCEKLYTDDIENNKAMGRVGADALVSAAKKFGRGGADGKLRVLTHCNTGALATSKYGTALGVITTLWEQGRLEHAYCTETRPYNQGARLTAYELVQSGIPATLICDNMASAAMAQGKIDAIVVGADRIAANGDTANKIGTQMLAILAAHHKVPMFTAAPTGTLDPNTPEGSLIPIEQRSPAELTDFRGERVVVEGIGIWNPSFDVAPATLLEGIITEKGCVPKTDGGVFAINAFLAEHGIITEEELKEKSALPVPTNFFALNESNIAEYVLSKRELAGRVGPADSAGSWKVREVGDGNINFVYIVEGPAGGIVIKQGLPYVRCVGEAWPLSQERARFEASSLAEMHKLCPQHVPEVYLFDEPMTAMAMQYLAPPCTIARHAMVNDGAIFPAMARHTADFVATVTFKTSLLARSAAEHAEAVASYRNDAMCELTQQVIFTDPYFAAQYNRHTSPQLDDIATSFRADTAAKAAATALKEKFMTSPQALLHGDLHTGSLMCSEAATYAIDSEFAFYGPIGFDIGKFIANLLMAFLAVDGHATDADPRNAQRRWLFYSVLEAWQTFEARFLELWASEGKGALAHPEVVDDAAQGVLKEAYMSRLFTDALGFGGAVIIRRIVGIAHLADFDNIKCPDMRARCERRALTLGRRLLVEPQTFASIEAVLTAVEALRNDGEKPFYPMHLG